MTPVPPAATRSAAPTHPAWMRRPTKMVARPASTTPPQCQPTATSPTHPGATGAHRRERSYSVDRPPSRLRDPPRNDEDRVCARSTQPPRVSIDGSVTDVCRWFPCLAASARAVAATGGFIELPRKARQTCTWWCSSGPSQHLRAVAAKVATASSVHGPATITTMCSMPSAAISEHRRAKASGDSPGCSRVLRVFSMSS